MLVLTRKPGQAVAIGDSIEIVVVEVRGDQVRLAIRAPSDISIVRKEIQEEAEPSSGQGSRRDAEPSTGDRLE